MISKKKKYKINPLQTVMAFLDCNVQSTEPIYSSFILNSLVNDLQIEQNNLFCGNLILALHAINTLG